MVMRDYHRWPVMPSILVESHYENEHNSTPQWIRRQAYGALLNGAAGHVMGNRPIWLFGPGWREALDSPGNQSMVHLRTLFHSFPWYELHPDLGLITAGFGNPRKDDFVSAARTSDGQTAVAYVPTPRAISVSPSALRGERVTAWWFDPRLGRIASAGEYRTGEEVKFETPGKDDWVLVLDSGQAGLFGAQQSH
jgi:hypothetical protein